MSPWFKYEFARRDLIQIKMFTIANNKIDSKFLACYINVQGLIQNLRIIKKGKQNQIGCPRILKHITEIYNHFLTQNCTLEQYFKREIIIAKKQRHSDDCYIENKIINGSPIIIVVDRKVLYQIYVIFLITQIKIFRKIGHNSKSSYQQLKYRYFAI